MKKKITSNSTYENLKRNFELSIQQYYKEVMSKRVKHGIERKKSRKLINE